MFFRFTTNSIEQTRAFAQNMADICEAVKPKHDFWTINLASNFQRGAGKSTFSKAFAEHILRAPIEGFKPREALMAHVWSVGNEQRKVQIRCCDLRGFFTEAADRLQGYAGYDLMENRDCNPRDIQIDVEDANRYPTRRNWLITADESLPQYEDLLLKMRGLEF